MKIKNWQQFQHYHDGRSLLWIRLYKKLLDDLEWFSLPGDAAKLLIGLWLLASEKNGELPSKNDVIFRLRITEAYYNKHLPRLSHWLVQDGTDLDQNASLEEKRREEKRGEEREEHISPFPLLKLKKSEYEQLKTDFNCKADEYLEKLSDYIGSKGDKYKSHYHTVRSWMRKDGIVIGKEEEPF